MAALPAESAPPAQPTPPAQPAAPTKPTKAAPPARTTTKKAPPTRPASKGGAAAPPARTTAPAVAPPAPPADSCLREASVLWGLGSPIDIDDLLCLGPPLTSLASPVQQLSPPAQQPPPTQAPAKHLSTVKPPPRKKVKIESPRHVAPARKPTRPGKVCSGAANKLLGTSS